MNARGQQSLGLSMEQRLQMVLAPRLRQSLEMLQLPVLELRALVQKELQQNPTLEEGPQAEPTLDPDVGAPAAVVDSDRELSFKQQFEILEKMDEEWGHYFQQEREVSDSDDEDAEKRRGFLLDSLVQQPSLQEHLLRQLEMAGLDEAQTRLGELIIGSINDDGYLVQDIKDLAESTGNDPARLSDILAVIQQFDPVGVGAASLKECLLIQLERLGQGESPAAAIVRDHIEALAAKRYRDIARALGISPDDVQRAARLIATLDPKPGSRFSAKSAAYIMPDAVIEKVEGRFVVIMNDDQIPRLRISKHYKALMHADSTSEEVRDYVRDRIRSGLFVMKSIVQRQRTLYNVISEIVRAQADFLEHGIAHLKPLTMAQIASVLGIHETTVCRALANKYVKTPQGIYELKFFFTPGLKTADGAEISNRTVMDKLRALIDSEDPAHPLSDQELMEKLASEGIKVARRTLAKYRVEMRIPPSHLRRI